ncbi:MAG: TAXI family TRAP transporter solute-binding subunit [Pseudomonadota bacterium]
MSDDRLKPDYDNQDPYRHVAAGRKAVGALILALLLALAAILFVDRSAEGQELRFFRIGTGTAGGTYFPIGGMIASAISGPPGAPDCEHGGTCGVPGLIAVALTTEGSVANIEMLQDGLIEAAMVQADVAFWAATGTGPFVGQQPMVDIAAIGRLYTEQLHVVVDADSEIHEFADLVDHRVSLGPIGSGTLVLARSLLDAFGISEQDMDAQYLRPEEAADLLADGDLDAFLIVGGAPVLAVADLAMRHDIRLVPIDGAEVIQLIYDQPFLVNTRISGSSYQGVEAQRTLGVGSLLVVRRSLDDDTVYRLTRALWHPTTSTLLTNSHPRGRDIVLVDAMRGVPIPLHPGAEAYYRLVGIAPLEGGRPAISPAEAPPSLAEARRATSPEG